MTKARDLGKLVSQGQPLADGTVQASEVSGLAVVATSGSYNDLLNKPTNLGGGTTDYNQLTNTPTFATVATSGSYADLTNKPTLFSGSYSDLTNKPTLFDGSYNTLTDKPTLFSGSYSDLTNKPTLFSGSYTDLTNKPTLFSGSYSDLTNKPTLFSGSYTDLTNKPNFAAVATSGSYVDLNNKPTIDAGPSITSLAYSGNDQATDTTTPLPVTIIGTGFEPNSKVYIDTVSNANSATSLQFSGTTQITFTPPAKSAASYNVWVVTPTGKMAVLVNGILYSGTPSWAGVATIYNSVTSVNIQLSAASGDTPLVYSLVSGTLPTGVTLSSSGLLSGTVTGLAADTSFPNIVIRADDPQNQDASITIQLNIIVQHPISRSLRFSNEDSTYLARTPASAGNRQRWTISYWIKRNRVQSAGFWDWVLSTPTNSGILINYDASTYFYNISFYDYGGTTSLQWLGNFRDLSAWYHVVLAFDSTQATDTNRAKCYVNGVELTQMSSPAPTWPTLNYQTSFNDAVEHNIGRWNWSGGSRYMDAYLAEINWVDGLALTPSSFGQINSKNVWEPKRYTGSYGTNGYYLNFSDNSNTTTTTLGKDNSGNNNNWTPNNFILTAGIDNDSLVDTPTNYGTDSGLGGEVRGNYCTLNPLTTSAGTYSRGNLRYIGDNSWRRSTGTIAVSKGKWYWEVRLANNPNSRGSNAEWQGFGICLSSSGPVSDAPGNMSDHLYFSDNGWYKNFSGSKLDGGVGTAAGDILSLALDLDSNTFTYRRNNTVIVTGTLGMVAGTEVVPHIHSYSNAHGIMDFNFGQRPFVYQAPSGFKALCAQNLSDTTIGNTSSTTANKFFNVYTWTGNGTNPRQHTGIGFKPDFVWIYRRDVSYGNWIYDSVRGVNKALKPSGTDAESTYGQVSSFDSDGFTQTGLEDQGNNVNGGQYIAYLLKAGDMAVTNTQGSITSTVSANTTSGFSIVSYTNAGSGTVGHGLGTTPAMIIYKDRISSGNNWVVLHKALGNMTNSYLTPNTTNAVATGINLGAAPTSTVISTSTALAGANACVAYCFAEVPGFSRFGSYTGNGSSNGPFVHLGFRPAFVLIKSTSTGSWCIFDTKRNPQNGSHLVLQVNGSSPEGTFTRVEAPDLLSNGFRLNFAYGDYNTNGVQYIYMAFAEIPFKHALAR